MGLSERWHSGTVVVGGRESVFHRLHLLRPVGCSDLQETLHILRDSNHAWVFEGVLKVLSFVPDGSYSRTFVCFFSFVLGFLFFFYTVLTLSPRIERQVGKQLRQRCTSESPPKPPNQMTMDFCVVGRRRPN